MTILWNNEKIKGFVKNTLGCGCPDKVFQKIDISELSVVAHEQQITRIVIGDTLLIYMIPAGSSSVLVESVESLASTGKNDRDRNSYNRFRLVVSGCDDDVLRQRISACFLELFSDDRKMHIHFINQALVDGLRIID